MPHTSDLRRATPGLLAILSCVFLAACQTSADEVLSLGDATPSEEASASTPAKRTFRDPYVVATSAAQPVQSDPDPARLKRKPVPLAAAYADIAEPPPEVLALQQQAAQGQGQPASKASPSADLGELTMQPTTVAAASNSLFSASQKPQPASNGGQQTPQIASADAAPAGSLVPSEMPTLGVNAVRKSLFSPSAEQQLLMQQQALQLEASAPAEAAPLADSTAASAEEPVLKKLSDPRPKRKMLALREPETSVPTQVQLTPDQLQAMGAVQEFDPAEPLPVEEQANAAGKKKKWLPSLGDLLKGGKKTGDVTPTP
ncbi:MAG: hypothetical protein ACK4ZU_06400 [Allorhizobium sp.]